MQTDSHDRQPMEIELKLALPTSDPATLEHRLARLPALLRRKASHLHLRNIYFDTPDQALRGQHVALRLRRVGRGARPVWLQTLKVGGASASALSRRGEWESVVPGADLSLAALQGTAWSSIDPDGSLFRSLAPVFVTSFERTNWTVRRRDRSSVEVSLDVGQIVANDKSMALCELELELLAGEPSALFDLALKIAHGIALLPQTRSKPERGYALAESSIHEPLRAQPPALSAKYSIVQAAQGVLREMFCQFTAGLVTLRYCDDPEVVHQARVGWRRFKSTCRLFRPALGANALPSFESLQALLAAIGKLRDLDVARLETLPQFASAYTAGHASREQAWQAMMRALAQAAEAQRNAVCKALEEPAVGATLLAITQWLEQLPATNTAEEVAGHPQPTLQRWARRRIARLHQQLKDQLQHIDTPAGQHRARILAKRLRYGIEAFKRLLAKRGSAHWYQQATDLQTSIGAQRDRAQAAVLVAQLGVQPELAEFLRGAACQIHP